MVFSHNHAVERHKIYNYLPLKMGRTVDRGSPTDNNNKMDRQTKTLCVLPRH